LASLFGATGSVSNPADGSYIAERIKEGAQYMADNSTVRCEKAANKCFTDACSKNPNLCAVDTTDDDVKQAACMLLDGGACPDNITPRKVITAACRATIGSNRDCKTLSGATDIDDVFEDIYALYFAGFRGAPLAALKVEFDRTVREQCLGEAESCIRQVCGNGNALVCHQQATENKRELLTGVKAIVGTLCNNPIDTNLACTYSVKANSTPIATIIAQASDLFANNLKNKFDPNSANKVETQCMATVQSCVQTNCGDNYYGCMTIGDQDYGLRVKLNDKIVKSFCWAEVTGDANCDTYFQIIGAKDNSSMLGGWGTASASGDSDTQNTAAFGNILRMMENIATSKREADYSSRMNRCIAQGGNTRWGASLKTIAGEGEEGASFEINAPSTMSITDTCWSQVTLTVDTSDSEINARLKKRTFESFWVPAGGTFTCGSWIPQNVFDSGKGNLTHYKMKDVNDKEMLPDWLKIGAAALAGGGAGTFGGTKIAQMMGAGNDAKSEHTKKLSDLERALSALGSYQFGTNQTTNDNLKNALSTVGSIISANSSINVGNALSDAITAANAATITAAGNTSALCANCATANTKLNDLKKNLTQQKEGVSTDIANAKSGWSKGEIAGAITGGAVGMAGAWVAAYSISEQGDNAELKRMNEALINKVAENMTCTVSLVGGGTKKLGLGESWTLPPL
jgi:hypothetical protein